MRISKIFLAVVLVMTVFLGSCQQKTGQKSATEGEEAVTDEFVEKLLSINPVLRDPSRIMVALDMAGADYIDGLVLPMENVDFYAQDEVHAAITLGVYTVDIAYLVSYGKNETALVKYERARKLSKAIGLQSSYEQGIFESYLEAGAHPDSLRKSLTLTAENIDKELTQMAKARHVTLYVTGAFIEKMYLVTQVINRYPTDLPADVRSQLLRHLIIALTEQEEPLDNLISLLNQIREEDEGEKFMVEMNKLKQVYVDANFKEMIANWTPDSKASGEYLQRITVQVEKLRSDIVAIVESE